MSIAELPAAGPTTTWSDDNPLYEIIDGLRVELPMSLENDVLANRLTVQLATFSSQRGLGQVLHEVLFDLQLHDRQRNRRPDVAFLSFDRWPADRPIPNEAIAWPVAPDLVIEFISPSEFGFDIMDKIEEYFESGVRQVWLVYPRHRLVQVYDSVAHTKGFREPDELDGGEILPGFRIKASTLFSPKGSH